MTRDTRSFQFQMSAHFVANMLGIDLYRDFGACVWELIRNGACACMPDPRKWAPEKVHIELSLVDRHPLATIAGTKTLVVFDRGLGFTEANLKAFFMIGPERDGTRHKGAAQKRIGKFAAFALNRAVNEGNYASGFYIMSRTSAKGDVLFLEITPNSVSESRASSRYISADSAELGAYRNHQGSFTAFVIPNAVFETVERLREDLRWYLPRRQDHALNISVNGKKLVAPDLCTTNGKFGEIEAYLGRRQTKGGDGGIWLADAETSLRCAHAPAMGVHMPYPLARPDLEGDIFIPGLLENQGTDRTGLRQQFLKGKAWKDRIQPLLQLHVASLATQLLGEDDVFQDTSQHDKAVREIADLFNNTWGDGSVAPPRPHRPNRPPNPNPTPRDQNDDEDEKDPTRKRGIQISIGGIKYRLRKAVNLDPFVYAVLNDRTGEIYVNEKYAALPVSGPSMREHVTMQLLGVVASRDPFEWDTKAAQKRQAELRAELLVPAKKG